MSTPQQLQRIVIRLLFDPTLVDQLYDEPEKTAHQLGLTSKELGMFHAQPRWRWGLDQERTHRALEGLLLHCPVSIFTLMSFGRPPSLLLEFFSSRIFHETIQTRALLAHGFLTWLTQLPQGPVPDRLWNRWIVITQIEYQLAQVRLSLNELSTHDSSSIDHKIPPTKQRSLSPYAQFMKSQRDTLDIYQSLSTQIHSLSGDLTRLLTGDRTLKVWRGRVWQDQQITLLIVANSESLHTSNQEQIKVIPLSDQSAECLQLIHSNQYTNNALENMSQEVIDELVTLGALKQ